MSSLGDPKKQAPAVASFPYRDPPKRPEQHALKGRPISLLANHFEITFPDFSCAYHYDVSIVPEKCPVSLNHQIIFHLQEQQKALWSGCKLAFDGRKNLYAPKPLPIQDKHKVLVKFTPSNEDREREFEVELQLVAQISLSILNSSDLHTTKSEDYQSAIQALDIIARSTSSLKFVSVGRGFYCCEGDVPELGQGRIVRLGRYQSVRASVSGISLNVDLSATAFYKEQPVIDYMVSVLNQGDRIRGGRGGRGRAGERPSGMEVPNKLTEDQRTKFIREIKGLRVAVTHRSPRKYKVKGITVDGAAAISFDCDGKNCTIKDYFKDQYGIELKYPDLPCLDMEAKSNAIYVPMEVCKIVEQHCNRKLTPDQTANMIKATATPANVRRQEILQKLEEADFDQDPILNAFDVRVCKRMKRVDGRVLTPPKIMCEGDASVDPFKGQWDIRHEKFLEGICIKKWALVVFPSNRYFDDRAKSKFIAAFCKAGEDKGMPISDPSRVHYFRQRDEVENVFASLKSSIPGLQLIVVILDRDTNYNEIKRVGDNVVGVVTQCVQSRNALRCDPATVANICLKVNAKLGGINSIVDPYERQSLFTEKHVIIFGADVTHPAPGDKRNPSIAAITASMDQYFMEYKATAKILQYRQEVFEIDQLTPVIRNMLISYYKRNNQAKPVQIIFFRDGVSEGQFKEVIQKEVCAIQNACLMLESTYRPGITFVVVQKRHHTRLFPFHEDNPRDAHGKSKNVPPGTVVDGTVTHPREFDFYLSSHAGIQGTSRPSHYHVLRDDNNFKTDDLQKLTYQLCHCYARCARSVSYPAPTYYSHLVAFRARQHLQDWGDNRDDMDISPEELRRFIPEMQKAIELNDQLKDTMYFV